MATDYKAKLAELNENNKKVFKAAGEAGNGFKKLHSGAIAAGSIDTKTKELMSLAIGIVIRCEGCIMSHTNSAIKAGATQEEINETVQIAILMGGGQALFMVAKH